MKKLSLFIVLTSIFAKASLHIILAQAVIPQFETNYNITYDPQLSGITQVTQNITIVNKQSDFIATSYSLTIKQISVSDVQTYNSNGPLDHKIDIQNGVTNIKVTFDKEVIGEGRKNNFTIKYESNDIAGKVGNVWDISFPKVQTPATTGEYNVTLNIPNDFGPEIFVSPTPTASSKNATKTQYTFNKEALTDKGISASFGSYQKLNFALKYELSNDSIFSVFQEIPLPSDLKGYQQVSYKSLEPAPESSRLDEDGNVIALYKLKGKQNLSIQVIGKARTLGRQIKPELGGNFDQIPAKIKNTYTRESKYWEISAPRIKELAKTLYDSKETVAQNAQKIYNYVVKNLKYDFNLVKKDFIQRNGALVALTTQGQWACMEFTDSFIALARANGIPARELDGYAFANDKNLTPLSVNLKGGDLLHAWPEFYDPNFGWVEIDPTWGTTSGIDFFTKLDTNHFAFVVKGISSEYPLPAGSYRFKDSNEKLISVDVAQESSTDDFAEKLFLYKVPNYNPLMLLGGKTKYLISNEGGSAVYDINGSKNALLPGQTQSIYLTRGSTSVSFENFNGIVQTKILKINESLPKNYDGSATTLWMIVAMLGLCTIVYFFLIHPKFLQKVFRRLTLRLRGLNQ